jgi:hypothetical protein
VGGGSGAGVGDDGGAGRGGALGCRVESYLTDPRVEPDMDRWETEPAFRLADWPSPRGQPRGARAPPCAVGPRRSGHGHRKCVAGPPAVRGRNSAAHAAVNY